MWTGYAHQQQTLNIARYDGETFDLTLSGLQANTEYSYRAYATYMKAGVWLYEYGETVTIRTKDTADYLPKVTTGAVASVSDSGATLQASLTFTADVETEYGFYVGSSSSNLRETVKIGSTTEPVDFTYTWTGLAPEYGYSYRAYAKNEYGEEKGEEVSFTTEAIQEIQLDTPSVSISAAEVEVGESFTVTWATVENATEYSVYVWNANGNEVERK